MWPFIINKSYKKETQIKKASYGIALVMIFELTVFQTQLINQGLLAMLGDHHPGLLLSETFYRIDPWGQSYKANFGIIYIKNGFNKLNFTMDIFNFDVIYAKQVL